MEANYNFKKLLNYAILGMSSEAQKMQERILRRDRFGDNAVSYPELHNPLRSHHRTNEEDIRRHDELIELMKRCQEMRDAISDKETEIFAKWFKSQNQPT